MRRTLANRLLPTDFLLHADMFNTKTFPTQAQVINTGLGETNLLNVAGGLAKTGKNVYIYGVAGFIIHRYEQLKFSCRNFGSKDGRIIICNAGKYGYDKFGPGHALDDDLGLMHLLGVTTFTPETNQEFESVLDHILAEPNGIFYIRLGRDQ